MNKYKHDNIQETILIYDFLKCIQEMSLRIDIFQRERLLNANIIKLWVRLCILCIRDGLTYWIVRLDMFGVLG